jgi:methyl-accepting chemotaxis protein
MNLLMSPARALMARLRFAPKMIVVHGHPAVHAAGRRGTADTGAHGQAVHSMQNERIGASYVRVLLETLAKVQQHRGMSSSMLNGDASLLPKVDAKAAEVAKAASKHSGRRTSRTRACLARHRRSTAWPMNGPPYAS